MLFNLHLPHFFINRVRREIEHLYASTAIGSLAQSMMVVFEPIFLYQALSFTIPQVLFFFAAVYFLYTLLVPLGGKIASRFGYAHTIFYSIPFQILFWFFLMGSEKHFWFVYLAPLAFAIQKSLYWPAFHASMARFANGQQRGREFSLMYAIMNLVQIIGPMLGGYLTLMFGINALLVAASIVYLCSAIPLFWSAEVFVPKSYSFRQTWTLYLNYPKQFIGYFGFAEELLAMVVWPLFIYIVVQNYQDTGTLVTTATLVATALALYAGIYTDGHSKRFVTKIGAGFTVLSWLARLPVVAPFALFIADAISRTSKSLVMVPVSALVYERAESTHIMPYVVGCEQALSFAKMITALLAALIFVLTGSIAALFILGAILSLLYLFV